MPTRLRALAGCKRNPPPKGAWWMGGGRALRLWGGGRQRHDWASSPKRCSVLNETTQQLDSGYAHPRLNSIGRR